VRNDSAAKRPLSLGVRAICFEDVPDILRMIRRSVDHGCRDHYDPIQRAAVFASYAQNLFVEALGPFDTVAAVEVERLIGVAQLDPQTDRLRALFVDADFQQRGVGSALLADVEQRAWRRGLTRLHGAMSLNAVPFYLRAGFRPGPGPERLIAAGVSVPVVRMEKTLRAHFGG
jgi:GNAT superfamily N-acetyltransferase